MNLFRRIGFIAALLAAVVLIVPVNVYADDESPETEIVTSENDIVSEEPVIEAEVIDEEPSEAEADNASSEGASEETLIQYEKPMEDSEETPVSTDKTETTVSIAQEVSKSAFELAAERLRNRKYADLSDLKIPEDQEDALYGVLTEQELIGSDEYLSFIIEDGYITKVELLLAEDEEEQEEADGQANSPSAGAVAVPEISVALAPADVSVSLSQSNAESTNQMVSESQPMEPENGAVDGSAQLISVLLVLSDCVRRALHLM